MKTFDAIQASASSAAQGWGRASGERALQAGLLQLAGQAITLNHGGVFALAWPSQAALMQQVQGLCVLPAPVLRYAGGALIADLSLQDNLLLEAALAHGRLPLHLLPEIENLFRHAGCPLERAFWAQKLGGQASATEVMQIRVGRALVADPDVLIVDAAEWDDKLLAPQRFSNAFAAAYPWRSLVWACSTAGRAGQLQSSLQPGSVQKIQELPA